MAIYIYIYTEYSLNRKQHNQPNFITIINDFLESHYLLFIQFLKLKDIQATFQIILQGFP